jgi:hypothetical protein
MATIEWALRRTTPRTTPATADFDWTRPPGRARLSLAARFAGALRRDRERATIDMASLATARETGCR